MAFSKTREYTHIESLTLVHPTGIFILAAIYISVTDAAPGYMVLVSRAGESIPLYALGLQTFLIRSHYKY